MSAATAERTSSQIRLAGRCHNDAVLNGHSEASRHFGMSRKRILSSEGLERTLKRSLCPLPFRGEQVPTRRNIPFTTALRSTLDRLLFELPF